MRPKQGETIIKIPITFDSSSKGRLLGTGKIFWALMIVGLWLLTSILVIIGASGFWVFGYPVLSFVVFSFIIRFIIMREVYFKKKRAELKENDFKFSHNTFWRIYDISDKYPYFSYFDGGFKGVFIMFDKDVIVGRPANSEYRHYEAIADAYQQMAKRGIECVHIDYMGSLGDDTRMDALFKSASVVRNTDLRRVLMRMYDNIGYTMSKSFASYDVYCFYFYGREDIFWDELQVVISHFSNANYLRHRVLNRDEISELVKSVMNVENFSVAKACESLFSGSVTEFIKPIWVECNGERTVLSKTSEEALEAKRVLQAERGLKKTKTKAKSAPKSEDVDLFGE